MTDYPLDPGGQPDLLVMTEAQRKALPARLHRPLWDLVEMPHSWICAACWTPWPCPVAAEHGERVDVLSSLDVDAARARLATELSDRLLSERDRPRPGNYRPYPGAYVDGLRMGLEDAARIVRGAVT